MSIKCLFCLILSLWFSSNAWCVDNTQLDTQVALLNSIQKQMSLILAKAGVLKSSISMSVSINSQVNCEDKTIATSLLARCNEFVNLKKAFDQLADNEVKVKTIILSMSKDYKAPTTPESKGILNSTSIAKDTTRDPFAADKETPACTKNANLRAGWKCLETTVTVEADRKFKVIIKWNRLNMTSRGSVLMVMGNGRNDIREDSNLRAVEDYLSQLDQVRSVEFEFTDFSGASIYSGGLFHYGGGFQVGAQALMATIELAINKNIFQGNFLNFLGLSESASVMGYAMAKLNADIYFDRVVLQNSPVFPDFPKISDVKTIPNLSTGNGDQPRWFQRYILNNWANGEVYATASIASIYPGDTFSLLKGGGKTNYPNTNVNIIMGSKDDNYSWGLWVLPSNLDWYDSIQAKSKSRIVRDIIGHLPSYEDYRRYLKLGPDDKVETALESCTRSAQNSCGCGTVADALLQADGCFTKPVAQPAPVTTPAGAAPHFVGIQNMDPQPTNSGGRPSCDATWIYEGNFWCENRQQHQEICACLPPGSGDSKLWNASQNGCFSHVTGKTCGADTAPARYYQISTPGTVMGFMAACSSNWANEGEFYCDDNKRENQKICNCQPPGYTNPQLWLEENGCFSHMTGRSCR
jgi:hypothetical protein